MTFELRSKIAGVACSLSGESGESKTGQSVRKNMLWLLEKGIERKRRKNYAFWI